ncbi:MAG: hypothetical protein ACD_65C00302G0005 [uncultured bacterium]|nr:MAG: hypothetical protein ACD_65C00302G0005 [uncultured bacterium]
MDFSQIIKNQVITEKSSNAEAANKYSFIINQKATKVDIKNTFEAIYGVKVNKVNIISIKPKTKFGRRRAQIQKREPAKKVIVTLAPNQKFDFKKVKDTK